jgi:ribonuclease P protein component
MASGIAIARRTVGPSSSAVSSRAGGGSLVERTDHGACQAAPFAMRRELRLRRRKEFDAVFRKGRSWNNDLLVLRTLPNNLEHNRFGFVTSKRVGKAVVRNRVRRRLKEGVRVLPVEPGWDVVISAKAAAARADFHELNRAVVSLLARAGILKRDESAEAPAK